MHLWVFFCFLATKTDTIRAGVYELFRKGSKMRQGRLAPSLCISYSTLSDIDGIIMNPSGGWDLVKYQDLSQPGGGGGSSL